MRFVYHSDDEVAVVEVDGRVLVIPPDELYEVPEIRGNDFNASGAKEYIMPDHYVMNKILEHGWYHGVVEVPMQKTKLGVTADIDKARVLAHDALIVAQDRILTRYVSEQQERVTQHNKSAIAPNGRVKKIIEARGIDLKKEFNINPPGYQVDKMTDRDAEIKTLREENARTQAQLRELLDKLGEKESAKRSK